MQSADHTAPDAAQYQDCSSTLLAPTSQRRYDNGPAEQIE